MKEDRQQVKQDNRPRVWAHRGANAYAPDNTLEAFRYAVEAGADGIELDIQQTKDNVLVVTHDERLERTSNGQGWVKDHSFSQLRQLDFTGGWKGEHRGPARIASMEEVFELIRPTGLTINIELKTSIIHYRGIEDRILEMAARYGMEERVIYSSFHLLSLGKLHLLNPDAKIGLLYEGTIHDISALAQKSGAQALHPAFINLLNPQFMENCRSNHLEVNVWTINTAEQMRLSCKAGVNAIITDYPDKAKQIVTEMAKIQV